MRLSDKARRRLYTYASDLNQNPYGHAEGFEEIVEISHDIRMLLEATAPDGKDKSSA